jgi:transposase
MSKKERRTFSKEFKEHAVRLIVEEGRPASEVARELGVNPNNLYQWKIKYLDNKETAFPGRGNMVGEKAEIKKLEKENKRLREEVEILKKATMVFARDN